MTRNADHIPKLHKTIGTIHIFLTNSFNKTIAKIDMLTKALQESF